MSDSAIAKSIRSILLNTDSSKHTPKFLSDSLAFSLIKSSDNIECFKKVSVAVLCFK